MAGVSRFRVRIFAIQGRNLAAMDRRGTSDPYVRVDFDGFKQFTTKVQKKELNPVWEDDVSFVYETKLVSKLNLKKLTLKVKDKDRWGSDDTIGTVQVDLFTLATGPVAHALPLRDGANVKGELCFSVEMEQESSLEVNVKDVELSAPQFSALDGPIVLQYMYNKGDDEDSKGARTSPASTTTHFPYLDILYLRTSYKELNGAYITFWVRTGRGFPGRKEGEVMARCDVPLSTCMTFEDGKSSDFDAKLVDPAGGHIGSLTGTVFFKNFPQFLQMLGGYHADDGIHQAQLVAPSVPNKPTVYIHGAPGAPAPAPAAAAGGWGGARSGPAPVPAAALAQTGVQLLRASGQTAGGYGQPQAQPGFGQPHHGHAPAPAGYAPGMPPQQQHAPAGYGQPHHGHAPAPAGYAPGMPPQQQHAPAGYGQPHHGHAPAPAGYAPGMPPQQHGGWHQGVAPASPIGRRPGGFAALAHATVGAQRMGRSQGALAAALGGAMSTPAPQAAPYPAPVPAAVPGTLPACWEKCSDPGSGKVYFKNHVYKGTEWVLPTQSRYTVQIAYAGPMGLELEQNFSGRSRTGTASGRRNSGTDSGAVVKGVLPAGQASQLPGNPIRQGHHLIAVNGQSAETWTFAATLSVLQQTPRPMNLTFHDPYAVDPEIARLAQVAAPPPAGGAPSEGKGGEGGPSSQDDWVTLTDAGSGKTFYMNTNTNSVSWTWPPEAK